MKNENMTFNEVFNRTIELVAKFKSRERKEWKIEGCMMELSKQVGELSKCVMSREKYYIAGREDYDKSYKVSPDKISDELSDILLIVFRIADYYKINLLEEHLKQLDLAAEHPLMRE